MTRPPKWWLAATAIWWGSSSLILLADSGQHQNRTKSLDWTIVEVTLGPDSFRGQCMGLGRSVLWEDTRTRPMTSAPVHGRIQGERLTLRATGSWDSGLRSRTTHEESKGKGLCWGQWEAGTQVYRSWKEARSRMTKESKGKGLHWGQWEAGTRCIDLGQTVLWEDTGWATSRQ